MSIGFIAIVVIVGMVQAIFVAFSLMFLKDSNNTANRFLIALMCCIAIALGTHLLRITPLWKDFIAFLVFGSTTIFLLGPAIYLYVRELTHPSSSHYRDLLHLLPWLAYTVFLLKILSTPKELLIASIENDTGSILALVPLLKLSSIIGYSICALRLITRHQRHIVQELSDLEYKTLSWVKNLIYFLFSMLAGILVIAISNAPNLPAFIDDFMCTMFVGLIFMTGFYGFQQPEIFKRPPVLSLNITTPKTGYCISNLNEELCAGIARKLEESMNTNSAFLDHFLDLRTLADQTGVTPHQLSEYLNAKLKVNFYDYINQHRVVYAQHLLKTTSDTILDIALHSGFSNKATFNKAFKKYSQLTPTDYRQQVNIDRNIP